MSKYTKFLQKDLNGTYKVKLTVGNGTIGCSDGPAAKAQLSEPTGLCFDFGSAIFLALVEAKMAALRFALL